jgi:hypothetical protein
MENLMNVPTSSLAALEKSLSADEEAEAGRLAEQKVPSPAPQIVADAERIMSSVARLTSSSIDGLEGLSSELQQLQAFLKSEVERVQAEIESAMAGIKIIMETIAPWKAISVPIASPTGPRAFRAGPAASIEPAQLRR